MLRKISEKLGVEMFETQEARILLMLRELQGELRELRAELDRCCGAMEQQMTETGARIADLGKSVGQT